MSETLVVPPVTPHVGGDGHLERLRAEMPSLAGRHYFNSGRHGPLPRCVHDAVTAESLIETERGRGASPTRDTVRAVATLRARVEALLHAPAGSVALTHNATEGVTLALNSLQWRPGDEVVTLTTEHESALAPIEALVARHGVVVRRVEPDLDPGVLLAQLGDALTPRTRAVMVSHVSWSTGAVVPMRALADLCHPLGALLVADGAQAAGMIDVDVVALDVDYYALPGQKWLHGPSGTGALYIRPDHLRTALVTAPGWASLEEYDATSATFTWCDDARRLEGSSDSMPARAGFSEALRWLAEDVGHAWAQQRIAEVAERTRARLRAVPGVDVVSPAGDPSGLVVFHVAGLAPDRVVFSLARRHVVVREVLHPRAVRACIGWYTTDGDVDALCTAVAAAAARTEGSRA